MYDSYHERARFLTIYISEAHPNDEVVGSGPAQRTQDLGKKARPVLEASTVLVSALVV